MDYLAARGVWSCLRCGWQCASSVDDDSCVTCGQRETRYCATCLDNGPFEYVLVSSKTAAAAAVQSAVVLTGTPTVHSAVLPVAHVTSLPNSSSSSGPSNVQVGTVVAPQRRQIPLHDELSSLTPPQLQELQTFLESMLIAVQKEARERTLCVICCSSSKDVVFYPCKHKCVCAACSEKLAVCPICRVPISDRILPYDS